ncbi:threonine/homoserine/homoserine lactone efflux protein [Neisseria perflava]|uniref:LysE family translocator n=1 Tax=Neisseria perflava TaxID=33053 RepID=UPI00209F235E|nr:LysE family transporter [Neisseria perflava]MCP1772197.1 threonine/homoserine/homoserine lactone efflux protein [Neisseria perflava]
MDFWHGFWIITGVHILACMSPGPDFVLVSQQALSRGRATGVLTALGIALGFGVHITYSVFGLVKIVAQSEPLLIGIKIIGGLYLLYIGYKGLRAKAAGETVDIRVEKAAREPAWQAVWRGFLCNVLNPKAVVYMLSLFTVVMSPATPMWQMAAYGVWMAFMLFAWFALVALMLSIPAVNQPPFPAFRPLDRPRVRRGVGAAWRESDERQLGRLKIDSIIRKTT